MHPPIHQMLIRQFAEEARRAELRRAREITAAAQRRRQRELRPARPTQAAWSHAPELALIALGVVLLAIAVAATAGVF